LRISYFLHFTFYLFLWYSGDSLRILFPWVTHLHNMSSIGSSHTVGEEEKFPNKAFTKNEAFFPLWGFVRC
jgi:hypothetical protein